MPFVIFTRLAVAAANEFLRCMASREGEVGELPLSEPEEDDSNEGNKSLAVK